LRQSNFPVCTSGSREESFLALCLPASAILSYFRRPVSVSIYNPS